MADDLLQPGDHVGNAFVVGKAAAHAGESNDAREAGVSGRVDALAQRGQAFLVLFLMGKTLGERMAAADGTDQAVLFQHGPGFRTGQFDRFQAHPRGAGGELFDRKQFLETPMHDRLIQSAVDDFIRSRVGRRLRLRRGGTAGSPESRRCREPGSAGQKSPPVDGEVFDVGG